MSTNLIIYIVYSRHFCDYSCVITQTVEIQGSNQYVRSFAILDRTITGSMDSENRAKMSLKTASQ